MPSDQHPIDALEKQFALEDIFRSPVPGLLARLLSFVPLLPPPLDKAVDLLNAGLSRASYERLELLVATLASGARRSDGTICDLKSRVVAIEGQLRPEVLVDLLLDAARKAVATRSKERVKRIGLILTNAACLKKSENEDEVEELMRVAMDLSDEDVRHLGELVAAEGDIVKQSGQISRHEAYQRWTRCPWGGKKSDHLDSVFSKLESYGLVSRIPPPSNLNILADFQNRYALLNKGLRFVELACSSSNQEPQ